MSRSASASADPPGSGDSPRRTRTQAGERLQVKARVVTDARNSGERELSAFRSWDFDSGLIVLFDDRFQVWRAANLPQAILEQSARWIGHGRGWRVMATDALLDQGEDWTERLGAGTAE